MSTFAELTDSLLLYLSGFSTQQDSATYLTTGIDADDTTLLVADASAIGRGLLEIGDELVWADSVDQSSLTISVPPYGRGYRSTTAAAHASGERVVSAPLIPRKVAKDAINDTLRSLFPDLYGVASTSFVWVPGTSTYSLPAEAQDVLLVEWQDSTTESEWCAVRRYRVNGNSDTTVFPTGNSITVLDPVIVGRTVRVVYTKIPSELSAAADVFATVTGLPSSCEDLVRLGAAYRLVPFLDVPHFAGQSAEADFSAQQRPAGNAAATSRYFLQQYQLRLQQEAARLGQLYPIRVHYTN